MWNLKGFLKNFLLSAAIVGLAAASLSFIQNTRSIQQVGSPEDLRSRLAALKDIRDQIRAFGEQQEATGDIVKRLAVIRYYAVYYGIDTGLSATVFEVATKNGFDPDLIFRIIEVESSFRSSVVSHKGAVGLMQVMPSTASGYGVDRPSLFDSLTNLQVGVLHLKYCLSAEDNDLVRALDRYNRGYRPDPHHRYAKRVLEGRDESSLIPNPPNIPLKENVEILKYRG